MATYRQPLTFGELTGKLELLIPKSSREDGLGIFPVILVVSIIFIAVLVPLSDTRKRHAVQKRLSLTSFRTLGATTQLRSLSFSGHRRKTSNTDEKAVYNDTLPPDRRESLRHLRSYLPPGLTRQRSDYEEIAVPAPADRKYTPHDQPFHMLPGNFCSPTGITVNEIRQLGSFPDYATLSGVPLPSAVGESYDIAAARPRPYRPLRWPYHQTMSLTKLEPDWWLELESTYVSRIQQRQQLFRDNSKLVLQYLPGSEQACRELMEMVLHFLRARYPQYFSLGISGHGPVFNNKIMNTTSYLNMTHPLHVLLDNIPEDFAIMMRNPEDGLYYMRAGLICSSLGWNVDTKIGKPLAGIHGSVPDYREKMKFSMDRFFAKMPTDAPIQRGSWGLEVDEPLFMPPDDPHMKLREYQMEGLARDRLHFRVDWQTLRRLPLSGAVVFNFKALFTPVSEFENEPYVPALLLKVLEEGKENMMKYKDTWHVEHVAKPWLKEMKERQTANGMVQSGWEETTLPETPFFAGWREKWEGQQQRKGTARTWE